MAYNKSDFSIFVIFFIRNIFTRCITISYVIFVISPLFVSSDRYQNQLNNLFFFNNSWSNSALEFNNASSPYLLALQIKIIPFSTS